MDIIKTKYKPFSLLPFFFTWKKNIPSKWDELTPFQLVTIAQFNLGILTDRGFYCRFSGIPKRVSKYISDFELLNMSRVITIHEDIVPYSRCIINRLSAKKIKIETPSDKLKNVSFGSFVLFDSFYLDAAMGKADALENFISQFCTGHKGKNKLTSEELLPYIAKIEYAYLYAILINYTMIREWLSQRYTFLFIKSQEGDRPKKLKKLKPQNWLPVFDSLISSDPANYEKFESAPMHTMLRYLNNKIKEAQRHGTV